ncbi:hypothetical protein ASE61_20635 [Bosea sp. Root670]|nr:hypothetical protein ASE61_20635 [Bosea sp. Root670]
MITFDDGQPHQFSCSFGEVIENRLNKVGYAAGAEIGQAESSELHAQIHGAVRRAKEEATIDQALNGSFSSCRRYF